MELNDKEKEENIDCTELSDMVKRMCKMKSLDNHNKKLFKINSERFTKTY